MPQNPTAQTRTVVTARGRLSKTPFLVAYLATSFNRLRNIRGRRPGYATTTPAQSATVHRARSTAPPPARDERRF